MKTCDDCGIEADTAWVSLHAVMGMIFVFRHQWTEGHLCRECIAKRYWEYTLGTLIGGWWGLFSAMLTPLCVVGNTGFFVRSLWLKRPAGVTDLPLPTGFSRLSGDSGLGGTLAAFDEEIVRRLRGGEALNIIAYDVAARADLSALQVRRYITLARLERAAVSKERHP
jgi:hypothetical protein